MNLAWESPTQSIDVIVADHVHGKGFHVIMNDSISGLEMPLAQPCSNHGAAKLRGFHLGQA